MVTFLGILKRWPALENLFSYIEVISALLISWIRLTEPMILFTLKEHARRLFCKQRERPGEDFDSVLEDQNLTMKMDQK